MLEEAQQTKSQGLQLTCQAVSPLDEPCDATATHHCEICGQWFCSGHAEDEVYHHCVCEPGDEGGEG